MSQPTADDVLMMAGVAPPSAQWGETAPSTIEGRVVGKPRTYHSREYDPSGQNLGKLKFYPSGDAIYGISIDLEVDAATLARDLPLVSQTSGIRRLYADKARLLQAIKEAVLAVKRAGVEPDGYLRVTWTGTEMGKGSLPANTYTATYSPPGAPVVPQEVTQALVYAQVPQAQPQAQYMQPVQHPQAGAVAQPAGVQPVANTNGGKVITTTVAAALANAGVDLTPFTVVPG